MGQNRRNRSGAEPAGPLRYQMFKSSPMEGSESARLMYLLTITAAEKRLRTGDAYFIPEDWVTAKFLGKMDSFLPSPGGANALFPFPCSLFMLWTCIQ